MSQWGHMSICAWKKNHKLIFNEMMMRSTLYYTNTLSFIVLSHWNNSSQIDMWPHWDILSKFRVNQSYVLSVLAWLWCRYSRNLCNESWSYRSSLSRLCKCCINEKKEIMTIIYRYWNSGLVTINFRVLKKCTIEDQKVTFVMVKIKLLWPI
jgi:hypothetical protein